MLRTLYTISFAALLLFLFSNKIPAQDFFDNFDSYTTGEMLSCQNSDDWITWTHTPCEPIDATVSNTYSYSSPNSMLIAYNDVVKEHGELTTGKWHMSFQFYIPSGKLGAFDMISRLIYEDWLQCYEAFACYFNPGGEGMFLTGDTTIFSYTPDTWQMLEVIIDLDNDYAEFWMGGSASGTMIKSWIYSEGNTGGTGPVNISGNAFFGFSEDFEMYVDDYWFGSGSTVPVELSSFTASVNPSGQTVLNWATASESNNRGFEVERKFINGQFATVGFVEGYGTTSEEKRYSYLDESVNPGKYVYRLKQIDFDGQFEYSDEIELEVTPPLVFSLNQNYPNPFNPSTNIKFSIAKAGNVKLSIYNTIGEEVAVLLNENKEAGFFEVDFDAANLTSGTYIYRLQSPGFVEAKKMLLMK